MEIESMTFDLKELPSSGIKRFTGEDAAEVLALDGATDLTPQGPIRYDLQVQLVSDQLIVRGKLHLDVRFACSRCGHPFTRTVEEPAFELVDDVRDLLARNVAVAEKDEGLLVDLTPEIREGILLAFPSFPVCKPECRGLCPTCGSNLNRKRCGCRPPDDRRWDGLEKLVIPEK
jgi:uncharacterized protein